MSQWFRKAFHETQSQMLGEATVRLHEDLVHREDFARLTGTVERLGERTERVAVAQEQTAQEMREVVIAQKETTRELQSLATAQAATQSQIGELAAASKATQQQIATLAWSMKDMQEQVGGLAQSVGCSLEAYAMERIPKILARQLGFAEESSGPEQFPAANGSLDDIDVVVRGTIDGRPVVFLCETKTNVSAQEVRGFLTTADRVRPQVGCEDVRIFYFAYRANPEARAAVRDVGGYLAFPHTILVKQAA